MRIIGTKAGVVFLRFTRDTNFEPEQIERRGFAEFYPQMLADGRR
jgi:hypothetical protein